MRSVVVVMCLFASSVACAQGASRYWSDSWRGWHFYEESEPEPPVRQTDATPAPAAKPSRAPELDQFDELRKRVEELRNIAIITPTEANVRRYMELEAKVVAQASYFADVAQRIGWSTPSLDMTLHGRPVNAQAIEVFDRQQREERGRTVAALADDHVLLFFFRSDCPYCHAFAPTLQAFEAHYGMRVIAVSMDGGGLPPFAQFRRDNGIANALNVTQVPAVFLAQPFAGTLAPIGFGVLSEAQLLERIATVASPARGAPTPGDPLRVALP